ncbi:MAG: transcriptional activator NhaR [Pseudomonadales bacterium]
MRHLNYNHLQYFWTVVRKGSIARASESLHLTPQTISGQLKSLEDAVGQPLFHRVGRGLVPSAMGQVVYQYADEIFTLGAELTERVRDGDEGVPLTLNVGLVNSIAKLISYRIVQPALEMEDGLKVVCTEGRLDSLLADLAIHKLDIVISDRPVPTGLNVRAFNHVLGESPIAFFAQPRTAIHAAKKFPQSLDQAPMLMPLSTNALRQGLDDWFDQMDVSPKIVAEFDDSALLKAFGEAGAGIFPAPAAITEEVERMYHVRCIGIAEGVSESYYAISPERKIKHPAVVSITAAARENLFAN